MRFFPGPPDPPAGVPTAAVAGPTSVTVNWSSPAFDGGHKLAGYIVETETEDQPDWQEVLRSSHSLSVVVTSLDPSKSYRLAIVTSPKPGAIFLSRFRVRAVNIHGSSEPSAPSEMFSFTQNGETSVNDMLPKFAEIETGDVFKAK